MPDFEVSRLLDTGTVAVKNVHCLGTCRHRSAEEKIHGYYLVMKKNHKSLLIHEDSVITLNYIRSLYSDGKNSKQVDDYLSNNGFALHLDNENKHDLNHEHMKNGVPDTL